ncbi:unnamed protein product [Pieris brassicae]|uniref:Uncharacterized protein n=1 Tax=Pieris brassicae TaxID=7116 RepID=A0A9P0TTR4_PIEBR|nr:unnamed protein product [Pieris brassicae]
MIVGVHAVGDSRYCVIMAGVRIQFAGAELAAYGDVGRLGGKGGGVDSRSGVPHSAIIVCESSQQRLDTTGQ